MQEVNSRKQKPRRSRPVLVADAIKEWVVKRDLSSGDKLPNESAMIDQFGVSKGTVREALRFLEAQGLIVTKTGLGGSDVVWRNNGDRTSPRHFYTTQTSLYKIIGRECSKNWNYFTTE